MQAPEHLVAPAESDEALVLARAASEKMVVQVRKQAGRLAPDKEPQCLQFN